MKVCAPLLAAMAGFLVCRASHAEPVSSEAQTSSEETASEELEEQLSSWKRPPSGTGLLIGGSIVTGIGVVNLATSVLCSTALCYGGTLVAGGLGLAIGIPMLAVGGNQRATYREWLKQHPGVEGISVVPLRGGCTIGWSADF